MVTDDNYKKIMQLVKNKDIEGYLDFIGIKEDGYKKDCELIQFDIMVKEHEGYFKLPSEYLTYHLSKILMLASKYNIDYSSALDEAMKLKENNRKI